MLPRLNRRQVLAKSAAIGAAIGSASLLGTTSGCSPRRMPVAIHYGTDSDQQYGLLMLPKGEIKGTAVLVHGGSWLDLHPATEQTSEWQLALAHRGIATWSMEYRRVGSDGGFPNTYLDIASGMDFLTELDPKVEGVSTEDLTRNVIMVGYSSGAQLAAWAASRRAYTPGGPPKLKFKSLLSLAGPLTMASLSDVLGGNVVKDFMGGSFSSVPDHYYQADPIMMVPANVPVHIMHDVNDLFVPPVVGETYCNTNRAAGGASSYQLVPGEHVQLGTIDGPAWPHVLRKIEDLLA